jgi:hypothetical protein
MRNDPSKYFWLFNNNISSTTISSSLQPTNNYLSPWYYEPHIYGGQYPSEGNNDKVYTEQMLLDESEKLHNKIRKDFANKTINDPAILSQSSSLLSLLPRSDDEEKEQLRSHAFQRSTGDANKIYIYREEHTFIQSEIDDNDKDMGTATGKEGIED